MTIKPLADRVVVKLLEAEEKTKTQAKVQQKPKSQKLKFSYKEQREFETIDEDIAKIKTVQDIADYIENI